MVGSGNLAHNLHVYSWGRHASDPYDWAIRFEVLAKEMMLADFLARLSHGHDR
jgi:4,5-DOPA dioxygenase extradiol